MNEVRRVEGKSLAFYWTFHELLPIELAPKREEKHAQELHRDRMHRKLPYTWDLVMMPYKSSFLHALGGINTENLPPPTAGDQQGKINLFKNVDTT